MSELVDLTIAELRANHDRLAAFVDELGEDQLKGPSGASEWTIADVLSHLGSGAEIQQHSITRALGSEDDVPENQAVWDRWNALPPTEQAGGFVAADERLVSLFESLTPEQRSSLTVDLGFLPAPVTVETPLAMRLNEQTLHGWDARVGVDPEAGLSNAAAELVLGHYAGAMSFMLGFVGKADQVAEPVRLAVGSHTIAIGESVALETGSDDATATYDGPLEAAVRLVAGRLSPERTPAEVTISGNVSLEDLRRVFPGY
ncbi:MAG: maleylpyruvate isomerase family mycothiol-dependent enzyme [Nocardioides sp.]